MVTTTVVTHTSGKAAGSYGRMATHKPLTLSRNFSWAVAGNVVYAASQWGMIVVLARLGNPEMVGQFALGLAVGAPAILFANLQLRTLQATDAKSEYLFSDYLSLRLITTLIALVVITGIALVVYRGETALVVIAVGVAKGFEAISDVFYGLFQRHEQIYRMAKSMMAKGLLSVIALGGGVYLTASVVWGVIGLAAVWALILVCYDARRGAAILSTLLATPASTTPQGTVYPNTPWLRLNIGTLRQLSWIALPLGVAAMLTSLNINLPRYFVEHYLGESELGIFAAMAYLALVGNVVIIALGQSVLPRLSKYCAENNGYEFRSLLIKLVSTGAALGITSIGVALVAGKEVLNLVFGPEYAVYDEVFIWLVAAAGFGFVGGCLGYGLVALRRFQVELPIHVTVAVMTILGAAFAVPSFGLVGAAWVTCIVMALQAITKATVLAHIARTVFSSRSS